MGDRPSSELAYGQQKLVGLARALALEPSLLLLDEPAAGMHRHVKDDFARILRKLRDELRIPMLWIEHDLDLVAGLASRVAVLDFGTLIAVGAPHAVLRDPRVARVYLEMEPESWSPRSMQADHRRGCRWHELTALRDASSS